MNETLFTIPLTKVIEEFQFERLYESSDLDQILIGSADLNRPGLQIVGFYDYFDNQRLQIVGKVEQTYLEQFPGEKRYQMLERLFSKKIPALIITRAMQAVPEMLELAEEYDVTLLRTEEPTSSLMSALISYLNVQIAPRMTRHGVLVEVYGEGILILGESGVGKSETAIELLKRGHRLVADDAVEIKRVSSKTLVGSSPAVIRHFVELRGIGIIDVKEIFGIGAVKDTESIDLIIHLEPWEEGKQYDRLGMVDEFTNIMGINVSSLTIPVKLGRNLAVIIEVAAMNNRQKRMGYNAAVELNNRLMAEMQKNMQ
ncbi:MAG TPA: HPr(Ser) kinase/phosphatase [Candidatus Avimonoglobus intestinipullorum]|uniref:HPr kinase/phosphorylase n=1 Tax=Candidatus Avimonoglobus intestinipullorum TaxID=2840699 RepID=A0A9D1LVP6_9FIRM|nr:HPr(Ser) kinase/phosphatase [Candidatus Avimonoglobus intestinipullorum]